MEWPANSSPAIEIYFGTLHYITSTTLNAANEKPHSHSPILFQWQIPYTLMSCRSRHSLTLPQNLESIVHNHLSSHHNCFHPAAGRPASPDLWSPQRCSSSIQCETKSNRFFWLQPLSILGEQRTKFMLDPVALNDSRLGPLDICCVELPDRYDRLIHSGYAIKC